MDYNPEADEINDEDLQAAASLYDRLTKEKKVERWEMNLNHATGRYEIGTPDAIPFCQFAEVSGEERARLMTAAPDLLKTLEETLHALLAHIRGDARRTGVSEQNYCPCHENEVKNARAAIAKAKREA